MPTIVDSLFLELGIDTTKFNIDQVKTLNKIQEFEKKAKKPIKNVGDAFRDLFSGSRIGAGASNIDDLSNKLTGLGKSLSVAGGVAAPLGAMTLGLGALLNPVTIGAAAVGFLGKEMWDLNKVMTANNATIDRQAQLTGTSASNMWAWAEAAKTVGANPMDISGGIANLQTSIMGMGIGIGNATPELAALTRLGVPWTLHGGVDIGALLTKTNALAASKKFGDVEKGGQPLGALHALFLQAGGNEAMWALATNPETTPTQIKKWVDAKAGPRTEKTLQDSLKSQTILGKLEIEKDILAETAYGDEQGLMAAVVTLLTKLLDLTNTGVNYLGKIFGAIPDAWKATKNAVDNAAYYVADLASGRTPEPWLSVAAREKMERGVQTAMLFGLPEDKAQAMIGSMMQESSMDPLKRGPGDHVGLAQDGPARQAIFAKQFHYRMASDAKSADQQFTDQIMFAIREPEGQVAFKAMDHMSSLAEKVKAFMDLDEKPGAKDKSLGRRVHYAEVLALDPLLNLLTALHASTNSRTQNTSTSTNQTYLNGDIIMHSSATTGVDFARDVRRALASQPLLTQTVTLATRGSQ